MTVHLFGATSFRAVQPSVSVKLHSALVI